MYIYKNNINHSWYHSDKHQIKAAIISVSEGRDIF